MLNVALATCSTFGGLSTFATLGTVNKGETKADELKQRNRSEKTNNNMCNKKHKSEDVKATRTIPIPSSTRGLEG